MIDEWQQLYPRVNVLQQLKAIGHGNVIHQLIHQSLAKENASEALDQPLQTQEQKQIQEENNRQHRQDPLPEKNEVPAPSENPPDFFVIKIPLFDEGEF